MKKRTIIGIIALVVVGVICAVAFLASNNEETAVADNRTIEELIAKDKSYFDNMTGKISFFESRIVMPQAFNKSDVFVAQEVTNVFQQTIDNGNGDFETNVYLFVLQINDCSTLIDIHKGAFVLDDKEIDTDSIKITFDRAFKLARWSNYVPSTSRYITLRHAVGAKSCNASYNIGNDIYGHLWVDAVTGKVTDTDPAK